MKYSGADGGSQWGSNDSSPNYPSNLQIPLTDKTDTTAKEGRTPYATVQRICERCGVSFKARVKEINRGGGRFCSRGCPGSSRTATRRRARKLWIERNDGAHPICRVCAKKADIHHLDGNPVNNVPANHDRLCRSHHTALENHLFPRRAPQCALGSERGAA